MEQRRESQFQLKESGYGGYRDSKHLSTMSTVRRHHANPRTMVGDNHNPDEPIRILAYSPWAVGCAHRKRSVAASPAFNLSLSNRIEPEYTGYGAEEAIGTSDPTIPYTFVEVMYDCESVPV